MFAVVGVGVTCKQTPRKRYYDEKNLWNSTVVKLKWLMTRFCLRVVNCWLFLFVPSLKHTKQSHSCGWKNKLLAAFCLIRTSSDSQSTLTRSAFEPAYFLSPPSTRAAGNECCENRAKCSESYAVMRNFSSRLLNLCQSLNDNSWSFLLFPIVFCGEVLCQTQIQLEWNISETISPRNTKGRREKSQNNLKLWNWNLGAGFNENSFDGNGRALKQAASNWIFISTLLIFNQGSPKAVLG